MFKYRYFRFALLTFAIGLSCAWFQQSESWENIHVELPQIESDQIIVVRPSINCWDDSGKLKSETERIAAICVHAGGGGFTPER